MGLDHFGHQKNGGGVSDHTRTLPTKYHHPNTFDAVFGAVHRNRFGFFWSASLYYKYSTPTDLLGLLIYVP